MLSMNVGGRKKKMKLKTLKDIKGLWYPAKILIKHEAIKWAKDVDEDSWDDGWEAFTTFFNITEEDLE